MFPLELATYMQVTIQRVIIHVTSFILYKLIHKVGAKNTEHTKKFGQLNQLKRMGYLCQIYDSSLYVP